MLDDFFTRALLAGLGLALVTGPAGCFVVWRRLAYFGESIAHSSVLGVAPLAATVAVAIKIVGILLIVAPLVIPAATVRRFAPSTEPMAAGAAGAGAIASVGGLYASATWDTPSGPSIVVTALSIFVVTRVDGLRRLGRRSVRRR